MSGLITTQTRQIWNPRRAPVNVRGAGTFVLAATTMFFAPVVYWQFYFNRKRQEMSRRTSDVRGASPI